MTQGSPASLLLKFSLPLLVGNLFQQLYSLVDAVVVGRFVGENELGGIGCTGYINYLVFSIGYGVSVSISIMVATMYGSGEKERLTKAIYNCAYVLLGISIFITIAGYLLTPAMLTLMQTPEKLYPHAVLYLRMMFLGSTGTLFYSGIAGVMRSFGDSRTPLLILFYACILNIVLDLVFVLVLHMQVMGVALATVIANLSSALICYVMANKTLPLFRYRPGALRIDKSLIKQCIRLGIPLAGQNIMIALSCIALQYVVNGFGEVIVTANTAVSKIENFVQQPFNSLATALSAYTGQNLGAGKANRIKQGLSVGIRYVLVVSAVFVLLVFLAGEQLLSIFVVDPEIIRIGAIGLRITSLFYVFLGLLYVVRGVLNGAGDGLYSAINGVVELVCRFSFATPLTKIPFVGKWGVFLCSGLTWMVTGLVSLIRFLTAPPQKKKLAAKEQEGSP